MFTYNLYWNAVLFWRSAHPASCFSLFLDAPEPLVFTHHLYDSGFLSRPLLLGHDVLGQNHAAEQGADASAGRGSDLHHGRPVHGGPLLLYRPARRPETPVLPSVNTRLPAKDPLSRTGGATPRKFSNPTFNVLKSMTSRLAFTVYFKFYSTFVFYSFSWKVYTADS